MNLIANLARIISHNDDANIVQLDGSAVMRVAGNGNFKLARQIGKFRMEGRPLPDNLGNNARVFNLVGNGTGILVGRDIADAVTGSLDGMHLNLGKLGQQIRNAREGRPVILNVLARGEMPVAAIINARDMGQLAKLAR